MLGVLLADAGRKKEAQEFLDAEFGAGFLPTRTGGVDDFLAYLYLWAEIAASLGDRRAAAMLFDRTLPAAGAFITTVTLFYGAIDRTLGRLATVLGRFDDAERYLENAEEMHKRVGAPCSWRGVGQIRPRSASRVTQRPTSRAVHELVERATTVAYEYDAPGVVRYAQHVLEPRLREPH